MNIDLELLSIQNPWWNKIGKKFDKDTGLFFDSVLEKINNQKIISSLNSFDGLSLNHDKLYFLAGARGIGKTTLLKLLVKDLIERQNIDSDNIFYYSCHNLDTKEQLNELIKIFLAWRGCRKERLFILIDEVTMIKDWTSGLSHLAAAGKLRGVTAIFTGSLLEKPTREFLNLRMETRIVSSLPFADFLRLINEKLACKISPANYAEHHDQLDYYLDIYFLTGGLLSAINSFAESGAVKQEIYSNYLYWLIADLAKLGRDVNLWRQIMGQVVSNLTQPVGYQTISKKTKAKTHLTVAAYLELMESLFAVKMVYQDNSGSGPATRKAKKAYFRDPFFFWLFYSYIHGALDYWQFSRERLHREDIFDCLVENVVMSHLIKNEKIPDPSQTVTYWRDSVKKKEINFLARAGKKINPILVRHSREINDMDTQTFKDAGFKSGTIISRDKLELGGRYQIMPLAYWLLFGNEATRNS